MFGLLWEYSYKRIVKFENSPTKMNAKTLKIGSYIYWSVFFLYTYIEVLYRGWIEKNKKDEQSKLQAIEN